MCPGPSASWPILCSRREWRHPERRTAKPARDGYARGHWLVVAGHDPCCGWNDCARQGAGRHLSRLPAGLYQGDDRFDVHPAAHLATQGGNAARQISLAQYFPHLLQRHRTHQQFHRHHPFAACDRQCRRFLPAIGDDGDGRRLSRRKREPFSLDGCLSCICRRSGRHRAGRYGVWRGCDCCSGVGGVRGVCGDPDPRAAAGEHHGHDGVLHGGPCRHYRRSGDLDMETGCVIRLGSAARHRIAGADGAILLPAGLSCRGCQCPCAGQLSVDPVCDRCRIFSVR
ncbi:hypothetical protein D3C86_1319870 [compost metagenome]